MLDQFLGFWFFGFQDFFLSFFLSPLNYFFIQQLIQIFSLCQHFSWKKKDG